MRFETKTTTVGIVTKEGVVLATDRRVTAGYYIAHRRGKKLWKIDDHIVATMSGGVADLQYVLNLLTYRARRHKIETGKPIELRALANYASSLLFYSRPVIFIVHMILGGYDPVEGPIMYALDWLGSVTREARYIATGSGSPYAMGVLENEYREDLTVEDAAKIAFRAVRAAIMNDPGSGEGIDVVSVTSNGVRDLTSTSVKFIIS